ncbi:MAG: hypothetical protein ACJ74W_19025 [Pyrinomonadaceae bacterium]
MMKRRFFTTLLVIVLTMSGASRARAVPRADEDLTTTAEEEREARALVEAFNKKLNATHDIAPLIKEYFVADFAARLPQHADTFPFILIEWKDKSTPPTPSDLQQFYVAATNFLHTLVPIWLAADEQRPEQESEHEAAQLKDALPPAAVELMMHEPALRELVLADDESTPTTEATANKKDDCTENCATAATDEAGMIENAEQLHHLACVFEDLTKILRAHLAAHPVAPAQQEQSADTATKDDDSDRFDPDKVEVFKQARILTEEFYGYPAGTRLVCASAGLLHVELVRVDGQLRILTVYLLIDD